MIYAIKSWWIYDSTKVVKDEKVQFQLRLHTECVQEMRSGTSGKTKYRKERIEFYWEMFYGVTYGDCMDRIFLKLIVTSQYLQEAWSSSSVKI